MELQKSQQIILSRSLQQSANEVLWNCSSHSVFARLKSKNNVLDFKGIILFKVRQSFFFP